MILKEVYIDIKVMHCNGKSIRAIAMELGLQRKTVSRHLASDEFPRYDKTELT